MIDAKVETLLFALHYASGRPYPWQVVADPFSLPSASVISSTLRCSLRAARALSVDAELVLSGVRGAAIISSCAPDPVALASLFIDSNAGVLVGAREALFIARSSGLRTRARIFSAGAVGGVPLLLLVAARRGGVPGWPVSASAAAGTPFVLWGEAALTTWFASMAGALLAAADALDAGDGNGGASKDSLTVCPVAFAGAMLDYPCIYDIGGGEAHSLGSIELRVYRASVAGIAGCSDRVGDVGTQAFSVPSTLLTRSAELAACVKMWRGVVGLRAAAVGVELHFGESIVPIGSVLAV